MNRIFCLLVVFMCGCGGGDVETRTVETFAADASGADHAAAALERATPQAANVALPVIRLIPGDAYFTVDGKKKVINIRNVAGRTVEEFAVLFEKARREGATVVRLHLSHAWGMGYDSRGQVDATWLKNWETLFDLASEKNLYVLPVFTVWADWNDGSKQEPWHQWHNNPLNVVNGGVARSPSELLQPSPVQSLWVRWMQGLVKRWSSRPNVLAWEPFSELNLMTGATETLGVAFAWSAGRVVRAADVWGRPVTLSMAGGDVWPSLSAASRVVDFLQFHLYGADTYLNYEVRLARLRYNKPVVVGESGVDWRAPNGNTLTTQPQGVIAARHLSWAGLVAGAANGRALWWEDGYALLEMGDAALDFVKNYPRVEPLQFLDAAGDFGGMVPLGIYIPDGSLFGGAVANGNTVIGWFRDSRCSEWLEAGSASPWNCLNPVQGAAVVIQPLSGSEWTVRYYDPVTEQQVGAATRLAVRNGALTVPLPSFTDAIAFRLTKSMKEKAKVSPPR